MIPKKKLIPLAVVAAVVIIAARFRAVQRAELAASAQA